MVSIEHDKVLVDQGADPLERIPNLVDGSADILYVTQSPATDEN
jgi:hypothetical protein